MIPENSQNIVYIGKSNFRGGDGKIFGIRQDDRFQHIHIIGQTGTGKTTLIRNISIQDIRAGRGLAVIDPHGEYVQEALAAIPEERMDDVIYMNPVDTAHPIGFNVLEARDPDTKHLIASGLMSIFTKIWANVWSARMEYIMNNSILALVDTPDATLLSITRMLVDKNYRQYVVTNCKDPVIKSYWINEYEQYEDRYRKEAIGPIQNKVGQFLGSHIIRNIVGQPKSTLDITKIMDEGKILLVNVSKGLVGEDNSALLGAMLITKIQLAAMERVRIADPAKRTDFILFIDEFQNFVTDSFSSILSEARKYRLGLVVSHQYIGQLITDQTKDRLKDAIFGNVGTTITFRVSATDAEYLEKHYAPYITADDLIGLPNRQIFMKMMIGGNSSRPFSADTLPPIEVDVSEERMEEIKNRSRKNYTKPRQVVEDSIAKWAMTDPLPDGTFPGFDAPQGQASATGDSAGTAAGPKYDLDLASIGIVEDVLGHGIQAQETVAESTPSATGTGDGGSASWFSPDAKAPKKKRKRKKRPGPGGGSEGGNQSSSQLRDALNKAMGS